ncbi:right-handed parallel beta-helix repeat-containing protein [Candidatus Saccharibacteria bacterium]|nr:right-handed parallel beta-helix repeat-containing protein [Candidatus Saccharibacteria bacterium]
MSYDPGASGISGAPDVAFGTKTDGQVITYDQALDKWRNLSPSASGVPWLVQPSSSTVDAGPLIQAALDTYGVAWIAAGTWRLNSTVTIDDGQSIIGQGQGTTILKCYTGLTGLNGIELASGTSSHFTIQGIEIHGGGYATNGLYFYATSAPTAPDISPDFVPVMRDVSVHDCTSNGIFVGGSYSGGLRESRFINLLLKHNGSWGLYLQSSDCFLSDITCHGNGGSAGGFYINGGNAKLSNCKAYYEEVGIQGVSTRMTVMGGEIQDCARAITTSTDTYLNLTVDSCGTTTQGAVLIGGNGCTVNLHFVGRTKPSGAPGYSVGSACLEMSTNTITMSGFVNTNMLGRTNDYSALYYGANRPDSDSVMTYAPSTVTP